MRGGAVERNAVFPAASFDLGDGVVRVGKLHARVAEHDHERRARQGAFHQFEQDDGILSARKGDVKAVELLFVPMVHVVDLLDRQLLK